MATGKFAFDSQPMNDDERPPNPPASKTKYYSPVHRDGEYYNMKHKHRGKVIIFNQETFESRSADDKIINESLLHKIESFFTKFLLKLGRNQDTKAHLDDLNITLKKLKTVDGVPVALDLVLNVTSKNGYGTRTKENVELNNQSDTQVDSDQQITTFMKIVHKMISQEDIKADISNLNLLTFENQEGTEAHFDSRSATPEKRIGTKVDLDQLKPTFEKLSFDVEPYDNPTEERIWEILEEAKQDKEYNKNCDCLVVVVMTHGWSNGALKARDKEYQVEMLWKYFTAHACPELAGKPKIFLIQACRGPGNPAKFAFDNHGSCENYLKYSIPSEADILIAFSTLPECTSIRNRKEGTWFIQALCEQLELSAQNDDLLSILTRVNRRVALRESEESDFKQMPMIQHMLTRKIYFGSWQADDNDELPVAKKSKAK